MTVHDPLDAILIRTALSAEAAAYLADLEILDSVDSTNSRLLAAAAEGRSSGSVCLAETQTAGRGRHGRYWLSPPGGNLSLSLLWRCPRSNEQVSGLSIATGIAVARTLVGFGLTGVRLKWPNDVYHDGRKLGGILLESLIGPDCVVVAGIGLNVLLPKTVDTVIDQPWTDLSTALGSSVSRNRLAAALLDRLLPLYRHWPADLRDLPRAWAEFDLLPNQPVELRSATEKLTGIARGIAADGALWLDTAGRRQRIASGELSLRSMS